MRISIQDLTHTYRKEILALDGISLAIETGEFVLLVGRNGSGKTTLLKHLNGILKPSAGDVFVGELNTRFCSVPQLARYVALSFQNPDDQIFSNNVLEEVSFGPRNLRKENWQELALEALQLLSLEEYAHSHPYDLHPSKRKLLTIASAIAMDTPIVAFDEPTAGFDLKQKKVLKELMGWLKQRGKTVIIVSHDLDFFIGLCDSVVILDRGRLSFFGRINELAKRADHRLLFKRSGLSDPILWRMSRFVGLDKMPSDAEEFSTLLVAARRLES